MSHILARGARTSVQALLATAASLAVAVVVAPTAVAGPAAAAGPLLAQPGAELRPSEVSSQVRDAAEQRVLERRESALPEASRASTDGTAQPSATAAVVASTLATGTTAGSVSVTRNLANTRASAVSSTLVGPAAVRDGAQVLYAGNSWASASPDRGSTWTTQAVPAGPAGTPVPCCGVDVARSATWDTTVAVRLYTDTGATHGVLALEVRRGSQATVDCRYVVDPDGSADDVLPDFPHVAVTGGSLFLSTNDLGRTGWRGATTRKYGLLAVAQCQPLFPITSTYVGVVGQRVHVPAQVPEGTTCEYWAQYETTSSLRWFQWCDSSTSPVSFTRPTPTTRFANPDCRGGVGDRDFVEAPTSWSIAGFTGRTAIGTDRITYLVDAAADATWPQAHLRGQTITRSRLEVVADPVVAATGACVAYPAVASNLREETGLSVAAGGRAGGGGRAAEGYVGVDDATTPGVSFPLLLRTAAGTHDRSDGRYGDSLTVRVDNDCVGAFDATSYALRNGSTLPAHVNARYVEFRSSGQKTCP